MFLIFVELSQCNNGSVRLVGGSGGYEGNVQVCVTGTWRYVCDQWWHINNAKVVCSQIGYFRSSQLHACCIFNAECMNIIIIITLYYLHADVIVRKSSFYGYAEGTKWIHGVSCSGTESKFLDCPSVTNNETVTCADHEVAGAFCTGK